MSTLAKIFVVFNLVLSVVFFGSASTLYLNREPWREAYMSYKAKAEAAAQKVEKRFAQQKAQINAIAKENSALQNENASLAARIKTQETEIAALKTSVNEKDQQIEKTLGTLSQTNETLQSKEATIQQQSSQIATLQTQEQDARAKQQKAVEDVKSLTLAFSELGDQFSQLQISNGGLQEQLEKYEVIIANIEARNIDTEQFEVPYIEGVVEAVNDSAPLVVLSVGRDQKTEVGFDMFVHRGGEYIGKLKVIRVFDDLSGARVEYTVAGKTVRVGDRVRSTQ